MQHKNNSYTQTHANTSTELSGDFFFGKIGLLKEMNLIFFVAVLFFFFNAKVID